MSRTTSSRSLSFVALLVVLSWALLTGSSFSDTITWTGATDNAWDTTTTNWTADGGGRNDNLYVDGDNITFDDTGANVGISLGASFSPGSMVLSASTNAYTFTGGDIAGGGSLSFSGTEAATFNQNSLSFTGGTSVNNARVDFTPTGTDPHSFGTGAITLNNGANTWFNYDPGTIGDQLSNDFIVNGTVTWRNPGSVLDGNGTLRQLNRGESGERTGTITLNGTLQLLQYTPVAGDNCGVLNCGEGAELWETVELTGNRTITGGERFYAAATTISGDIGHDGSGPHEITLRHRGDNPDWEYFISDDNVSDANGWDVSNIRRETYSTGRGTVVFQVDETSFFNNLTTNGGSLILEGGGMRFSDEFTTPGGFDPNAEINFSLIVEPSALGLGTGFRGNTSFEVQSGGSLGGTGIYRSGIANSASNPFDNALDVDVLDGGTLSPGNPVDSDGIGVMTMQGDVAFTTGGTLVIEVKGAGGVAGTDFDQLVLQDTPTPSGTGNLSGLSNATLEINIIDVTFDQLSGQMIDIVLAENDLSGLGFGEITGSHNGIDFEIIYGDGFIRLQNFEQHIPEPSSGLLIVCGALGLAAHRRRNRRKTSRNV